MKLSSCNLLHLYQEKTRIKSTSANKEPSSRNCSAATFKIEKLPLIQSSILRNNIGLQTEKWKTNGEIGGDSTAAILPKMQAPPVARMTTTFTESYRGVYGPPAPSTRRREVIPGPFKTGFSSYTMDFGPKPLRKCTPSENRKGNILNSYPGNVLYPYTLPEQVITVWKPFPNQKSKSDQTDKILARIVKKMYRTSYQLDFTKSGTPITADCPI